MSDVAWKDIPEWEGLYKVSRYGEVYSVRNNIVLRPANVNGYAYVCLHASPRRKTVAVHSLVALTFIGLRPKDHDVLHGTQGRSVNYVDNLRYGTRQENANDAMIRDGKSRSKPTGPIIRCDGRVYESNHEAATRMGISPLAIRRALKYGGTTKGDYRWKYYTGDTMSDTPAEKRIDDFDSIPDEDPHDDFSYDNTYFEEQMEEDHDEFHGFGDNDFDEDDDVDDVDDEMRAWEGDDFDE